MNLKTLILVIILAVLIGIIILIGFKFLDNTPLASSILSQTPMTNFNDRNILSPPSIQPAHKPTLPPIGPDTNLKTEIDKLTPTDFSDDFKKLKEILN